jgi:hypothetical protein
MMESWEHAAKNILTHFHVISQGGVPFTEHWEDENIRQLANIDEKGFKYLEKIKGILAERGKSSIFYVVAT